ncbi:uncharacterized protein LOC133917448 [Phragmites australis]|uniref:uncharacterized protein LOC133917448 n=1 Tax=Phragmites australis TaxID=29695 RepID=UPI002D79DD32|nr:uncharacterized protein LOC133917448 [Phragmites australis]
MGSTLSCIHGSSVSRQVQHPTQPAPVRIIAADGSLKELPASPLVAVSDVLAGDAEAASFFMCNCDALDFNEQPPALPAGELLRPGQIYFMLQAAMLGRPLSNASMAALAVRASAALAPPAAKKAQRRGRGRGGKKTARVIPAMQ